MWQGGAVGAGAGEKCLGRKEVIGAGQGEEEVGVVWMRAVRFVLLIYF